MSSDASIRWGDVELLPDMADEFDPDLEYYVEASGDGMSWGNPTAIITAVQSRLRDGSLATIDSYGNREQVPLKIRVKSTTYDGLGAGEEALNAETRRHGFNTLTWTPSVSLAVPTVFDVVYSWLNWDFDDLSETMLERYFTATLEFLPFPRSVDEVVQESLDPPGSATVTSINTCAATTGWSKPAASSLASTGGKIVVTGDVAADQWAELAAAVTMSGDRFVRVDWQWGVDGKSRYSVPDLQAVFDGVSDFKNARAVINSPVPGYTRSYFECPASWATVQLLAPTPATVRPGVTLGQDATLRIDQVSRTDAIGEESTGRQQFRSLPVAGSVRTQGRLSIEHEDDPLGQALIYIYCNDNSGYAPPLRRNLVSAGTTHDDASLVSGHWNMLDTPWVTETSATAVPEGSYEIYALIRGSSAGTVDLTVSATSVVGGVDLGGTVSETATVTVGTEWGIYDLTGLDLGPVKLATPAAAANAVVRITIEDADDSGIDVDIDEAWICNLDLGAVTHVICDGKTDPPPAPGGPCNRLWLDPATVTNDGEDAVYIGFAADRSDAFNPAEGILGWTPPVFEPNSMNAFVVTTKAAYPAIRLAHYPRWLHNARAVA